jgi:glycosyltransferase involved in cell wall biosynthesis
VSNFVSTVRLRALIREFRPDVVHAHSAIGGVASRLAAIGTGVPVVYTPNGIMQNPFSLTAERMLRPLTSRLIAVSESEALSAARLGLIEPQRIRTIPNGIDLDPSDSGPDVRSMMGLPAMTPLVGTIMRLIPQKAPEQFVKVAESISAVRPDVHFVLIGMGPLQHRIDEEVANRRLSSRFHQIPHLDNAAGVLHQLDAFVLPSRFEGGPYAALEAMRSRTPVVLSDVVGNADVVQHRRSGILVPFGDTTAMAQSVVEILECPSLRHDLISEAEARLREVFDVRKMSVAVGQTYKEVTSDRDRRSTRRLPRPRSSSSNQEPDSSAAR